MLGVVTQDGVLYLHKLVDGGLGHADDGRLGESVDQVATILGVEFTKEVDVYVTELREGGEGHIAVHHHRVGVFW